MQPEHKKKPKREEEKLGCLIGICEVCSEPLSITQDDVIFVIESDFILCGYCKQKTAVTHELKEAAMELL